ncbi:phage tail tape measure protein [Citrobacter braakii]|uniref:phage tail length tape measure family protein n=1 Tax=Citrobacter braakii TaxID=57706 RepID=UPI00146154F0|nr:phage tail length tape measure family protein [Citrobacter braakii]MBJ9524451.1 phage tail length tape measure family protein [Citrobacter braakii]MEB0965173.1 phage tail length tape measure family protein [Citrobacter braakii]NMR48589.1 phage tail tape measure protein [Citrobacter braakii]
MTEQTSRLAIVLDSSGAKNNADNLATALARITQAGEQAERSTDSLKHEFIDYNIVQKSVSKETRNHRQELSEQQKALAKLRDQIDPVSAALDKLDDRYQELKKYQKAGILPDDDFDYLASKLRETEKAINGEALAERAAAKARDEQSASLQRLSAQLDPIGTAFKRLADQQKQLDSAKASGMLSPERYDVLSSSLATTRKQLEITQDAMKKTGVTSRAMAYQMRMIPAQMTDIVVSLASGQAPMTVLLQQGGQLKDMFGGIGPAIKGVGGYVAGLINPFTLAAAAVGVLGLAYYKGSKDQDAYNKSIILTGGYAGKTAGELQIMAKSLSTFSISQSQFAEGIAKVVGTGSFSGSSIMMIADTAEKMRYSVGVSVDDTIKQFQRIQDDPVNAVKELDKSIHFLTATQLEQITTLAEQGRSQEAARIAMESYSSAIRTRSEEIKASLGSLETAWNWLGDAAKSAWDKMLDIGRVKTTKQQIDEIERKLVEFQTNPVSKGLYFNETGLTADDLKNELKKLQEIDFRESLDNAREQADKNEEERKKREFNATKKLNQQYENEEERHQRTLNEIRNSGASQAAIDQAIQRENARYEKSLQKGNRGRKGKSYTEDAATRLLDQLNRQHEVMQQQLNTTEKIGTAEQALVKWKSQLSEIQKKGIITAEQKSLLANQASITAQYEKNADLEKEIALRKDADKLTAYKNTLSSGLQNDAIGLQNSLNSNTILSQEQKRQQELTKIASDYQKKQVELTNQRTTGQISQSLYDEETAALQQALNQRLAMQQAYYSQLDQLNGNWQLGVQNGLQSYLNSVPTLYESVTSAATSILSSTESAISSNLSAMVQGTESLSEGFKNMATGMGQAVIDALTKMAAQWLVYQAVQLLVGKTTAAGAAASMIGQATAMSQIAGINAYASAAAIPITGWAMAPAAMATALAATTPLIASVAASSAAMTAGVGLTGMAHNGIDSVPSTGTWLLEKGERVMTAQTSARLDSTLENLKKNGLDATLSKPGYGTGVQNVSSSQNATTVHAPIEQNVYVQGGDPEQLTATLRKNNEDLSRTIIKLIDQKMTGEVINPQGNFGKALKSRYVRGYKE